MSFTNPRLGINIDHIATLRQARGEAWPCPLHAAELCLEARADQITVHLREDRRHIQDSDVFRLKQLTERNNIPLNLEMGASRDIFAVACQVRPDWICLVPENRLERTTEGGLDLIKKSRDIEKLCLDLKNSMKGVKISLFVESRTEIIERAISLPIDAVEIHTGKYAEDFNNGKDIDFHLNHFERCRRMVRGRGLGYHAGHGLTMDSLGPLLENHFFEEYNIGHWVVSAAVFDGLGAVVQSLKNLFRKTSP